MMNTFRILLAATFVMGAVLTAETQAAEVSALVSAREAYVGNPILLRIEVANAGAHEPPQVPSIDGLDIRSVGTPRRSSQISIINGHRTERVSVVYAWQLTARREGVFTIPEIAVNVDGRTQRTRPIRFSATKSETGDLLFAEIEGRQDQIFVGQAMDLNLRIWLRPYSNARMNLTLSEGDMWQMISLDKSNWGVFAERLQQMAANNERPAGREVLRADSEGVDRRYYLYEIDATVYPKRPGQIDGDEVQIVVDYPTQLGKSRDPFRAMFDDESFFGGRIPNLLRKDMPSMFGPRLRITESRPIVASAEVNATDVLPIPTKDRPAQYRGAVGRYKIVTQASPLDVKAGDPITLHLGIQGDGPMDLVQAPPLSQISELTADFKVAEEPLAGIVKGDVKMFTASVRPRRAGIAEIPAIPFSYFDPAMKEFVTIESKPIAISVAAADQLALDSIVGAGRVAANTDGDASRGAAAPLKLENYPGDSLLKSKSPAGMNRLLSLGIFGPPLAFLVAVGVRYRWFLVRSLDGARSNARRTTARIRNASTASQIAQELLRFVAERLDIDPTFVTTNTAQRLLETRVTDSTSSEVVDVIQRCEQASYAGLNSVELSALRDDAVSSVSHLSRELPQSKRDEKQQDEMSRSNIRVQAALSRGSANVLSVVVLATSCLFSGEQVSAIELTADQQAAILAEANTAYELARASRESDSAESKQSFAIAARKYQTLVDSGIANDQLFFNLGNAYLQSGTHGRAVASYEQAIALNPTSPARANLKHVRDRLPSADEPRSPSVSVLTMIANACVKWNAMVPHSLRLALGMAAWFGVWAMASVALFHVNPAARSLLAVASLVAVLCFASQKIDVAARSSLRAVVVVPSATLRAGNGDAFDELGSRLVECDTVQVLERRNEWLRVATDEGAGWLRSDDAVLIAPSPRS